MPIYEFVCQECGKKSERLCRLGESGEGLACPACSTPALKKVFSAFQRTGRSSDGHASGGCSSCSSGSCSTCH